MVAAASLEVGGMVCLVRSEGVKKELADGGWQGQRAEPLLGVLSSERGPCKKAKVSLGF